MAHRSRTAAVFALVIACLVAAPALSDDIDGMPRAEVRRRGSLLGLDPGLALRMDDTGLPLYARLDIRVGGCIRPWLQLGGDMRGDLLVTINRGSDQKRWEIGPVATFFLVRGFFARLFVHLAGIAPWSAAAGAQTGYELSAGKYSAWGFYAGAGAELPFDGEPPRAYDFSIGFYLTAYDLAQRRGRDPGGY